MSSNQYPTLKWAQRKDKLYITINVVHSKTPKIEINGKKMKYEGTDGSKIYSFDLELFDEIDKENSKYTLDTRNIFLNLKKKNEGEYWPRLTLNKIKYHWIEIDWNYFVDEDEEEEGKEPNFEGKNLDEINGEINEENDDEKNNEDNRKKIEKKDVGTNTENYNENDFAMLGENKADISDLDEEVE